MRREGQTDNDEVNSRFSQFCESALKKREAFHMKVCSTSRKQLAKHLLKRKYFLQIAVEK